MKQQISRAGRVVGLAFSVCAAGLALSASAAAQQAFVVKPVAEKTLGQLPAGPLYWQVENFPTLAAAQAAEGPSSLVGEVAGKIWLFTIGAKGSATHGASKVVEIGPVPPITASAYLLRINNASGPPGAKTAVHTHPGAEAFYVLAGELGQKTPQGESRVEIGQSMPGRDPGTPMEISSRGTQDLNALVMFVVDATKPFSSPAKFE